MIHNVKRTDAPTTEAIRQQFPEAMLIRPVGRTHNEAFSLGTGWRVFDTMVEAIGDKTCLNGGPWEDGQDAKRW